jgi:signal recognition particle subunit SRP54
MTKKERRNPGLLDGSRRRRIAAGAGVQVQDVNKLMKQFMEMQKMMKSFSGGKMKRMMQAFKGGMPPGFPGPR